jgi:transcriptional regulator with XRE-family HTH domain
MTGEEAAAIRQKLQLSLAEVADEHGFTPSVVESWENGSIPVPRRVAERMMWLNAVAKQESALAASGLPECELMKVLEDERVRDEVDAQMKLMERLEAHHKDCRICQAREKWAEERRLVRERITAR